MKIVVCLRKKQVEAAFVIHMAQIVEVACNDSGKTGALQTPLHWHNRTP